MPPLPHRRRRSHCGLVSSFPFTTPTATVASTSPPLLPLSPLLPLPFPSLPLPPTPPTPAGAKVYARAHASRAGGIRCPEIPVRTVCCTGRDDGGHAPGPARRAGRMTWRLPGGSVRDGFEKREKRRRKFGRPVIIRTFVDYNFPSVCFGRGGLSELQLTKFKSK